jgi:hypothetical protein
LIGVNRGMNRDSSSASVLLAVVLVLAAPSVVRAGAFEVNPEAGNNSLSAVFDAKLGERINAVSSAVGCELTYDEKTGLASGKCSVPIESIRVDNDDTKSDHFRQWATNKKSDPTQCRIEAVFAGVKVGTLTAGTPATFGAEIPFTVCGRVRTGGEKEKVTGTALLFPPGTYGERATIRIRAAVADFDRDAYRIGPKYTDGWLARVQALATVVAEKGTVELSLFAKAK